MRTNESILLQVIALSFPAFIAGAAGCGDHGGDKDADGEVLLDPLVDPVAEEDTQGDQPRDPVADETADGAQDPATDPRPDAEDTHDGQDAADGTDASDTPDAVATCDTDEDCAFGMQWCVRGSCTACDNTGLICDLGCSHGWGFYVRNGCTPCKCAPPSDCVADGDCISSGPDPMKCYAGALCWDWCPAGDPSCCVGNICSQAGCTEPPPVGCFTRGCPEGEECASSGCTPSGCYCGDGAWGCTNDCGGGTCYGPD